MTPREWLGSLLCRVKGHRWSKAGMHPNPADGLIEYGKICRRCGAFSVVRSRKRMAT